VPRPASTLARRVSVRTEDRSLLARRTWFGGSRNDPRGRGFVRRSRLPPRIGRGDQHPGCRRGRPGRTFGNGGRCAQSFSAPAPREPVAAGLSAGRRPAGRGLDGRTGSPGCRCRLSIGPNHHREDPQLVARVPLSDTASLPLPSAATTGSASMVRSHCLTARPRAEPRPVPEPESCLSRAPGFSGFQGLVASGHRRGVRLPHLPDNPRW